jgi:enoyl-CoA hydratase/carnithine racemase
MPDEQILYEVADRVATITLNRPDKLNAWTAQMESEVSSAIGEASADAGVRAIVLTGAGRGFCAGADMSILDAAARAGGADPNRVTGDAAFPVDVPEALRRKYAWLLGVPKPIVAAINGPAVGLGFIVPLYCDIRLASAAARFSTVFARRGLVAEYGLAWMLPRLVGLPNAIDLLFTSRTIDAAEALRISLVTRVFPEEGFAGAAHAFARELADTVSPRSLRVIKRQIWEAQQAAFAPSFDAALLEMVASLKCDDFREGVAHFLEKRPPAFTGR